MHMSYRSWETVTRFFMSTTSLQYTVKMTKWIHLCTSLPLLWTTAGLWRKLFTMWIWQGEKPTVISKLIRIPISAIFLQQQYLQFLKICLCMCKQGTFQNTSTTGSKIIFQMLKNFTKNTIWNYTWPIVTSKGKLTFHLLCAYHIKHHVNQFW